MIKKFPLCRSLLLLSLLLPACSAQLPSGPTPRLSRFAAADQPGQALAGQAVSQLPPAGPKALTFMSYEAADNDLYPDLDRLLTTLDGVGGNARMNLLAQIDSQGTGNSARYVFAPMRQTPGLDSPYLQLPAAAENSGDPQTLADAVRWGFGAYPARVNWLNISGHGSSFEGISVDENPQAHMNIISFGQALKAGLGGKRLDLLSFDACMMAAVEVASELQDTANILVASEDATTYWGRGFEQTLRRLAPDPTALSPAQIARSLVLDIHAKGPNPFENPKAFQTATISATDLNKLGELESLIDQLARNLRRLLPTQGAAIARAAMASQDFTLSEISGGYPYRDLNRLLAHLRQQVKDPELSRLCDAINHLMYRRGLILFSRQNKIENGEGRGLTIYLPSGDFNPLYRQTRFARSTQWDEFLLELAPLLKKR